MTRSPLATGRALIDRVFPRGALLLSFLSFVYFLMGIVRNRVFANTYGAGPELDAYNAAFRIPEIALDVLVAAGLTAPFVPIFSSLRHDDETSANGFGRTVLTARAARDGGSGRPHLPRRALAGDRHRSGLRRRHARAVRPAGPHQLPRAAPLRRVDLPRRDPRREPALPVVRARADPVHRRDHRRDGSRGRAVRDRRDGVGGGGRSRDALGRPSDRHPPDDVPLPTVIAGADLGLPRVRPTDDPEHAEPPDRAGDLHVSSLRSPRRSSSAG